MAGEDTGLADGGGKGEQTGPKTGSRTLVRLLKPVIISPERGQYVDPDVVSARFYNCFHYSLLSKGNASVSLTVGITSANKGEGKTLVASNLGVSFAIASQRETVLVDLNVRSPQLHRIFGTQASPGLVEALNDPTIQISQTQIEHLYVLPMGDVILNLRSEGELSFSPVTPSEDGPSMEVGHLAAFRDVIYSLKQEFDFVIIDMPAMRDPSIPVLLTNQMDGLLIVVSANRTRHEDLEKMFQRVDKTHVLGFILNRASPEVVE